MEIENFTFGQIAIDGVTYAHDVVIDRGKVRRRKKKPSKNFRAKYGHTPLSTKEAIPWNCERLIIGTGAFGSLPITKKVKKEAERRNVALEVLPTDEAIKVLNENPEHANAILHVTC